MQVRAGKLTPKQKPLRCTLKCTDTQALSASRQHFLFSGTVKSAVGNYCKRAVQIVKLRALPVLGNTGSV